MAEEGGQVDAGAAVAEPLLDTIPKPSAPTMNFSTAMDTEGNFKDGWQSLLPEDIRGDKNFETMKSFPAAMTAVIHAQRLVGKDKIALPNENSTEAEYEEFYAAIGRPTTPSTCF